MADLIDPASSLSAQSVRVPPLGFVLIIIGVIWLLGESRVASRPRVRLAAAARLDRLRSQERSVRGRDAEAVEVRQHGAAQVDR
jgi:hypothetical protein